MGESRSGDAAIGTDQAAGAELDAAEVADDADGRIGEPGFQETFQNRNAGGSGWLLVVAGALDLVGRTDEIGSAYMRGIRKFIADAGNVGTCFFFGFGAGSTGKKSGISE